MAKKPRSQPCTSCALLPGEAFTKIEYLEKGERKEEKLFTGWCWSCYAAANFSANMSMLAVLAQSRNDYWANNHTPEFRKEVFLNEFP